MTDQAPDSPPRPQYGEYATPEEQRARIRQPAAASPGASAPMAASAVPAAKPQSKPRAVAVQPASGSRPRLVDRFATFALLGYGLINIVTSVPALVDYGAYTEMVFKLLGVTAKLSDPAAGRPWGIAAAIVLVVGWLVTAALSLWSIRRGRVTWWIPLTGGIVFTFISGALMLVPLMSDPTVWHALVTSVR